MYIKKCRLGHITHSKFRFVTVPLDSPQNFAAQTINSTSIQLSWDRPSTPNGVITYYSLVYTTKVAGGPSTGPVSIMDTMFTVNNLNEYTEYVFSVAAATGAGLGPPTKSTNRTAEDGAYGNILRLIYVHMHMTVAVYVS